jgi:hypothetical protein
MYYLNRSKILYFILILLFCLILSNTRSFAASSTVYNSIDQPKLINILRTIGGSAVEKDDDTVIWMIDDDVKIAIIKINDKNNGLILFYFSNNIKLSPEKVNEWNMDKYVSKIFLDKDGDPFLELDYDLTGGVSEANIISFFNKCVDHIDKFIEFAK